MTADHRSSPRLSTSVPLGIRFPKGDIREGWGRIININSSGLLIETHFNVNVAEVLYVSFFLKAGVNFQNLRARVIRASYDDGYTTAGLAFDELVDQETLKDVLASLVYEGGFVLL